MALRVQHVRRMSQRHGLQLRRHSVVLRCQRCTFPEWKHLRRPLYGFQRRWHLHADEVSGCTNEEALNYDEEANHNGTCVLPVPGCTSPNACNYQPEANVDNGTCESVSCPMLG